MVIIGYAFRDAHINATLRQRTRPDATVVVINPQERFDDTPIHARIVEHLKEGFGENSVETCLAQIRSAAGPAVSDPAALASTTNGQRA